MGKKTYVTPIGTARFPYLSVPDNKFGDNKYKCSLALDEAGFAQFKAALDEFMAGEKFITKKPALPFSQDENDPSIWVLKATSGADYKPAVVDSKNNRLPKGVDVGGGSRIRMGVTMYNYDKGVSLRLNSVQVIELAERGGVNFDVIDDGYEAPQETHSDSSDFSDSEDMGI